MTTAAELAKQTVKDLRSLASRHKIPSRTRMKKAELIEALAAVMATATGGNRLEVPAPSSAGPSSSGGSTAAPRAAPDIPAGQPDPGLPIPDRYGQDRLVLLAQDPHHVYAYWELTDRALDRARAAAGADAVPLLLLHGTQGTEQRVIDLASGNYYLAVGPDSEYVAEIALRSADGRLVRVVASAPVRTPALAPSERIDEEWLAVDESFEELLVRAGLPGSTGSSASLTEQQRLRSRLWNELAAAAPMGASEGLPSSPRSGGGFRH